MSKCILLVEDDFDDAAIFKRVAERSLPAHTTVIHESCPECALNRLKTEPDFANHIDLIVSDYNMPKMNGLEFIKAYKSEALSAPIVLLTTYADRVLQKSAEDLGALAVMLKPSQISEFTYVMGYLYSYIDQPLVSVT